MREAAAEGRTPRNHASANASAAPKHTAATDADPPAPSRNTSDAAHSASAAAAATHRPIAPVCGSAAAPSRSSPAVSAASNAHSAGLSPARRGSSPRRIASAVVPSADASAGRTSASGSPAPVSHFETARFVTLSACASSSCVSPFSFLFCARNAPVRSVSVMGSPSFGLQYTPRAAQKARHAPKKRFHAAWNQAFTAKIRCFIAICI